MRGIREQLQILELTSPQTHGSVSLECAQTSQGEREYSKDESEHSATLTLTQCDSLCDSADDFCQNRWHDPRLFGAGDPRMMQRVVLVVVSVVMRMVVIVRRRSRH